ncbi:MAG: hypothetical protein ABIL58_26995 [Pseudomonadota bacterium]
MIPAISLPEDSGWPASVARQAAVYMAGDGHTHCVARVEEGALVIADHLMRLQRAGELFSPELKTAGAHAH